MAQENARVECSITNCGVESSFNTAPSFSRIIPVSKTAKVKLMGGEVPNDSESPKLFDAQDMVSGLKSWELELEAYVKSLSSRLYTGTLTTPQFLKMLAAWFGGQSPADGASVGATTTGSPGTATSVNVVSDANITVGELLMIPTANGNEVVRCTAKPGSNALTLNPGLSTTPSAGAQVSQMVNLYPTDSVGSPSSCAFQVALADSSNEQYQLLGGIGGIAFKITSGGLLTISVRARGKTWTRGALSITATVSSDSMGSPIGLMNNAKLLLQATATATATHVPFEEINIEYDLGLDFTPDAGGANEGAGGVIRSSGRSFAKINLKCKMDAQFITWYTGKTALQLLLAVPDGNSGTSRQHIAWYVPKCKIDTAPQPIESGGRRLYDISLSSRIDTSASGLLAVPGLFAVG